MKPIHALFGAALLGAVVMPIAVAGAKDPQASASANTKKQIKTLSRRVAALESKPAPPTIPTTLPPSGPAGGSLVGSYPDPRLGPDTVSGDQISDGSIDNFDVRIDSLNGGNIRDGSVAQPDLGAQSVGAGELNGTYERVSRGTAAPPGTFVNAAATCNAGDKVLGGGWAWLNESAFQMEGSTPNVTAGGFNNPDEWIVTGSSAIDNELFAWAVCISA
jgi:hypothetical protein